jgi:hypothetical protein
MNSTEENSSDFCPNYVLEFGFRRGRGGTTASSFKACEKSVFSKVWVDPVLILELGF